MPVAFSLLSLQGLLLCGTFFFAGLIDAVCGGGGLLTIPMFMATGFPVHLITGTNQCSIVLGSMTSTWRFARSGQIHWKTALMTVPFAILASSLGARLNLLLPTEWLEIIMTLLVPVVAAVMLFKRNFGQENHSDELSTPRLIILAALIGLVIGCYQGFYGAGSGAFFLLAFALLMRLDLTMASGTAKVVGMCSTISCVVTYALAGTVVWPVSIAATVFNVAGSYIGAGLAMKKGARFIRPMFLFVLLILFIRLVSSWIIR